MRPHRRSRPIAWVVAAALSLWLCHAGQDARGEALDTEVLDWVKHATVYVSQVKTGWRLSGVSSGSGFFVSPEGHLVTSAELVKGSDSVQVIVDCGLPTERVVAAKVIKGVPDAHMALLKTDAAPDAWLMLATGRCPSETERVWAVGFPQGIVVKPALATNRRPGTRGGPTSKVVERNTLRPGPRTRRPSSLMSRRPGQLSSRAIVISGGSIISLPRGANGRVVMVQTNARLCKGDGGGPLIDATGRVVGVALRPNHSVAGLETVCAVPAEAVFKVLQGVVPLTAEAAYHTAVAYRKEHTDDPKGTYARFRLVVQGWPESRQAKLARKRLDTASEEWQRLAEVEFDRRRGAAAKAAKKGDYQGAIAELRGFPDRLLNDRWAQQIAAAVAPYLEADTKLEEIRRAVAEFEAPLWREVFPHFQSRRYDEALACGRDFLDNKHVPNAAACMADLNQIADAAKEFWAAVLKGAPHAENQKLRLKGALWQVAGVKGDGLVLRFGGAERLLKPTELSVEQAIVLAEWPERATRVDYTLACVHAFDAEWDQASKHAGRVATSKKKMKLLALITLWRGHHAEALLEQAGKAVAGRKYNDAMPLLEALRDSYADLEPVKRRLPWIEHSIARASRMGPKTPVKPRKTRRICRRCSGTGKIAVTKKRRSGMNWEIYRAYKRCPACNGTGRITAK